jgi:Uma2 family endonuclease
MLTQHERISQNNYGNQQVEIYRSNGSLETQKAPNTISGEEVLPSFVLNLAKI